MKILVTGGAGFIGSHIVDRYLALGHELVVIDNLSTGRRSNVDPRAKLVEMCITDVELNTVIARERPDVISHHAAQIDVRKSVEDPIADARVNIMGSLNLCEAARQTQVKKIIFASTGGAIYGEQQEFPASPTHSTDPRSPYGVAKLAVEKYLQHYWWNYGIPCVMLRYANVYGPRQNAHGEAGVVAIFTEKLLRGETPVIFGDGKQTRDYVFVDDVVASNVSALGADVVGIHHVSTGIETDVNAMTRMLIELTGKLVVPHHAAPKVGEQMQSVLMPGMLTQQQTPIEEGLTKTVSWFQEQRGFRV